MGACETTCCGKNGVRIALPKDYPEPGTFQKKRRWNQKAFRVNKRYEGQIPHDDIEQLLQDTSSFNFINNKDEILIQPKLDPANNQNDNKTYDDDDNESDDSVAELLNKLADLEGSPQKQLNVNNKNNKNKNKQQIITDYAVFSTEEYATNDDNSFNNNSGTTTDQEIDVSLLNNTNNVSANIMQNDIFNENEMEFKINDINTNTNPYIDDNLITAYNTYNPSMNKQFQSKYGIFNDKKPSNSILMIQSFIRCQTERVQYINDINDIKRRKAIIIQSYIRGINQRSVYFKQIQLKQRKHNNSLMIQSYYKGLHQRCVYLNHIKDIKQSVNIIWLSYRAYQNRIHYKKRRKLFNSVLFIQSNIQTSSVRLKYLIQIKDIKKRNALIIQSYIRGNNQRLMYLKQIGLIKLNIQIIWKSYRGLQCRNGLNQWLNHRIKEKQKENAILRIQNHFRGYHQRWRYLETVNDMKESTRIVWKYYRRLEWKLGLQRWLDVAVKQTKQRQKQDGLLVIQSFVRGSLQRIKYFKQKTFQLNDNDNDSDDDQATIRSNSFFLREQVRRNSNKLLQFEMEKQAHFKDTVDATKDFKLSSTQISVDQKAANLKSVDFSDEKISFELKETASFKDVRRRSLVLEESSTMNLMINDYIEEAKDICTIEYNKLPKFIDKSLEIWNLREKITEFMSITLEPTRIRIWDKFDKNKKKKLDINRYLPRLLYTITVLYIKSKERKAKTPKYDKIKNVLKYMATLIIESLPKHKQKYIQRNEFVSSIHMYLKCIC